MAWIRRLLGAKAREVDGSRVQWMPGWLDVTFAGGRSQRIRYTEFDGLAELATTVAYSSEIVKLGLEVEDLAHTILRRNRETRVVGFRFGSDRRIEAWVAVPRAHLQPAELLFYVMFLAREADRFEYLLTRSDRS